MDSSSLHMTSPQAWGKLTSFTGQLNNSTLNKDSYIVGSSSNSEIHIDDQRLNDRLCKIFHDPEFNFWIEDLSNGNGGVLVEDQLLGKGEKRQLRAGDIIHFSAPNEEEKVLGFVFSPLQPKNLESLKKPRAEVQQIPQEEIEKRKKFEQKVSEEIFCSICLGHIYQCVTIMPCLHNYCMLCAFGTMQEGNQCPRCREEFNDFKENASFNKLIASYVNANPHLKRKPEEYQDLDKRLNTPIDVENFRFSNVDSYSGTWLKGKKSGFGTMTYANGAIYQGNWVENKREGNGTFTTNTEECGYEGEWKNDVRHGKGREIYENGDEYEGEFVDGKKHGEGIMYHKNGECYKEIWENGELQDKEQLENHQKELGKKNINDDEIDEENENYDEGDETNEVNEENVANEGNNEDEDS